MTYSASWKAYEPTPAERAIAAAIQPKQPDTTVLLNAIDDPACNHIVPVFVGESTRTCGCHGWPLP